VLKYAKWSIPAMFLDLAVWQQAPSHPIRHGSPATGAVPRQEVWIVSPGQTGGLARNEGASDES
jgi:hypothetical protein